MIINVIVCCVCSDDNNTLFLVLTNNYASPMYSVQYFFDMNSLTFTKASSAYYTSTYLIYRVLNVSKANANDYMYYAVTNTGKSLVTNKAAWADSSNTPYQIQYAVTSTKKAPVMEIPYFLDINPANKKLIFAFDGTESISTPVSVFAESNTVFAEQYTLDFVNNTKIVKNILLPTGYNQPRFTKDYMYMFLPKQVGNYMGSGMFNGASQGMQKNQIYIKKL